MNVKFRSLTDLSYNHIQNLRDAPRVLAVAAGMAAARAASIPSSPVENIQTYYELQVFPLIQTLLDETNECVVMEYEEAVGYARTFWSLRYNAAQPVATLNRPTPYGFFDTILGANLYVDNDSHSFVNQYKKEIFELHDCLVEIYDQVSN